MPVDVRIIVATNEDLKEAMYKGSFREDIYYRVNEFKIELNPLRKNKDELSEFVQFFLKKSNEELDKSVETVSEEAWKVLYDYPWTGNIRELKKNIKRDVLMANSKIIKKVQMLRVSQLILYY